MAAPGPANMIARRVTDDLIAFSGETAPRRYMKFFLTQKLAKSRHFVNRMHDEADTLRDCVAQMIAVIAEHQAMSDQDEVHDSLSAAKDAKRSEESKLVALNDVITEALENIETQETNVEILDDENNGFVSIRTDSLVDVGKCKHLKLRSSDNSYVRMDVESGKRFSCDKLTKVVDSSHLQDKMKVVFVQAHGADESFIALISGRSMKPLNYMKEMVGRDFAMLGFLEQLLASTHVGMRLKASYVAKMIETE
ncbi:hypothetical protein Tco_1279893 [Tanacetum coccineum]